MLIIIQAPQSSINQKIRSQKSGAVKLINALKKAFDKFGFAAMATTTARGHAPGEAQFYDVFLLSARDTW